MTYRVEITAQALAEIDIALQWLADQSPSSAARWYAGLRATIGTLKRFPRRCPLAPENEYFEEEIRQLLYGRRRGTYRVLFEIREAEQMVYILHVVHGARQHLRPAGTMDEPEEEV